MRVDYIIVGQGLAGSLLCWELQKNGADVLVFDNPEIPKSSDVAAGLVNPVVFRRMTKTWLIDELYPQLIETYNELERELGIQLFYPMQIKKLFGEGEDSFWKKKTIENDLNEYINPISAKEKLKYIYSPYGIGEVEKSGRVDIRNLIGKFRKKLIEMDRFRNEAFDYTQVHFENEEISYQDISAKTIIFCEGHNASNNPFFKEIEFKHTKGEVLRIKTKNYASNFILNKAMFLMPENNQYFRLGATYEWDDLSDSTTEKAKQELQKKLSGIFKDDYKIVDHQSGIRPTTHNRRPVIGLHPNKLQVGIFNGLGSKGSMLGPYFAKQFAQLLKGEISELHPEVKIERYYK